MSSSQLPPSKGASQAGQVPPPSQLASQIQGDSHSRRSGGSFGSGASTRPSSSPRNNQSSRKQHKTRRPKLSGDETMLETAAIRSTSSRKGQTSITHLMNFSLPPRPQPTHNYHHGRNGGTRRPTWGLGSGYHATDKARYIHANYRFIVDPRGSYHRHKADPDVHVDWNDVLQILASAHSQDTSCPICLSTPIAPRMAKCGHIFCLPCLIRYFHSSDDLHVVPEKKSRWKTCPICWDSIFMSDMRPVRWYRGQEAQPPQEGGDIVLRLMMRRPESILALPRDGGECFPATEDIPWHFAAEVTDYARIMKGTEAYMLSSFDQEVKEIHTQEQEDQVLFGEEDVWTQKAVSTIQELKQKTSGIGNPPSLSNKPDGSWTRYSLSPNGNASLQADMRCSDSISKEPSHRPELLMSNSAIQPAVDEVNALSSASKNRTVHKSFSKAVGTVQRTQDPPFYFYQALLHYYLSPLDIRILKAAFGEYHAFPATILPRAERVSTGHIVDDDLRRRAKYLGHLPKGCEVNFLECDWTDVVSPSVLNGFAGEIDRRRRRNREKELREEKERLQAEKEEDEKRWAAAKRRRPSMLEAHEEASMKMDPGHHVGSIDGEALGTSATSSSPPWGSSSRRPGSAFASLASHSTSPSAPRTVWGTAAISPSSPQLYSAHEETEHENDGWLQNWENDILQEDDDLVSRVKATSLGDSSSVPGPALSTNSRKKKGKKITIMSTNARRAA